MLVQCLGAQVDLVGLEVERPRAVAHGVEAVLGRLSVLAELFEALAAGPYRVDLVLIVVAQRGEDAVEPLVLPGDEHVEPGQRGPLGLETASAGGRRRPLLGVPLQAPFHFGLALGQDAAPLGDTGDAHLELLPSVPPPPSGVLRAPATPPAHLRARAANPRAGPARP